MTHFLLLILSLSSVFLLNHATSWNEGPQLISISAFNDSTVQKYNEFAKSNSSWFICAMGMDPKEVRKQTVHGTNYRFLYELRPENCHDDKYKNIVSKQMCNITVFVLHDQKHDEVKVRENNCEHYKTWNLNDNLSSNDQAPPIDNIDPY